MYKNKDFLDDLLTKSNALSFLRLFFAILVIISHSFPIGGFGAEPKAFGLSLGGGAVAGFFTISGYLITNSRVTQSPKNFFIRRLLRIYPGYLIAIFFTAFIFAPLIASKAGSWSIQNAVEYVAKSFLIVFGQPNSLQGSVAELPYDEGINGSLWTLAPEVIAYATLGLLYLNQKIRNSEAVPVVVFAILAAVIEMSNPVHEWMLLGEEWQYVRPALVLWLYFLAGNILFKTRKVIQKNKKSLPLSILFLILGCYTETLESIASIPLAFLILWTASALPEIFRKVGKKNDISYGVYIYAFPVQQTLTCFGIQNLGYISYFCLTLATVFPLATASWFFVERPFIDIGKAITSRGT